MRGACVAKGGMHGEGGVDFHLSKLNLRSFVRMDKLV